MAEFDFNIAVTKEIDRLVKGKLSTYSAQPESSSDVPLYRRVSLYNARTTSKTIGFSNHGNANANKKTKGFGVFYWKGSKNGKKLAQMMLAAYKKEFPGYPIWGSGIFESKMNDWTEFAILRDTRAAFILIEWDFFTNDEARKRMLTSDYRKRCAKVAASVALDWHNKAPISTPKPAAPKPAPKPVVKPAAPAPKPVVKPVVKPKEEPTVAKLSPEPAPWAKEDWEEMTKLGFFDGNRPREGFTRQEGAKVMNDLRKDYVKKLAEKDKRIDQLAADVAALKKQLA